MDPALRGARGPHASSSLGPAFCAIAFATDYHSILFLDWILAV